MGRRILPPELSRGLAKSSSPFRKKRGFDVPVTSWFRNVLGEDLQTFLTGSRSMLPNWLDAGPVRQNVGDYLRGSGDAYRMVLAFYVLEVWLRNEMGDRAPSHFNQHRIA